MPVKDELNAPAVVPVRKGNKKGKVLIVNHA